VREEREKTFTCPDHIPELKLRKSSPAIEPVAGRRSESPPGGSAPRARLFGGTFQAGKRIFAGQVLEGQVMSLLRMNDDAATGVDLDEVDVLTATGGGGVFEDGERLGVFRFEEPCLVIRVGDAAAEVKTEVLALAGVEDVAVDTDGAVREARNELRQRIVRHRRSFG
jgi:hypothetical protein